MFQICHYEYHNYLNHYFKTRFWYFIVEVMLVFVYVLPIGKFLLGVLGVSYLFKKTKVKFRITKRIMRLIVTILVIIVLLEYLTLGIYFIPFYSVIILFADVINKPINSIINKRFVNEAKDKLKKSNTKIISVVGSMGKTSTKNIIYDFLSDSYLVIKTEKSFNTKLGITKTINQNNLTLADYLVLEMGASYVGEIEEICHMYEPNYVVVTSLGYSHLKTFKTLENIIKTKLAALRMIKNGFGLVNIDNEYIRKNIPEVEVPIYRYGLIKEFNPDFYAEDIVFNKYDLTQEFTVYYLDRQIGRVKTKLLGAHNISNLLAGIAISILLNVDTLKILAKVQQIDYVKNRLELKKIDDNTIILDDSYNSNIVGNLNALQVLDNFTDYHKCVITPGMVELGEKNDELNRMFAHKMKMVADRIVIVGKTNRHIFKEELPPDKTFFCDNFREGLSKLLEIEGNKTILISNDLPDNY